MDYLVLTKVEGMFMGPISQVLGWIMDALFRFTSSFGVLNIGLSIILFTLVVKILIKDDDGNAARADGNSEQV